jgi:hypothetical protein
VIDVDHARLGRVRALGNPVKISPASDEEAVGGVDRAGGADRAAGGVDRELGRAETGEPSRGAPILGQHTREVLSEAGFDADRIGELEDAGVVLQSKP